MEIKELSTNIKVWKILFAIAVIIAAIFAALFYFQDIFITFIIGFTMIIITNKVAAEFRKNETLRRYPAWKRALYGYGQVILILVFLYFYMGDQIQSLKNLIDSSLSNTEIQQDLLDSLKDKVPTLMGRKLVSEDDIQNLITYIYSLTQTIFSKLSFIIINGVLIIPLMFQVFYRNRKKIWKSIKASVPEKFREGFIRGSGEIGNQLYDFFSAKVSESLGVATITTLGLYIAGVKGAIVLGLFAGLLNIVPYLGPIIGAIPAVIFGYLDSPATALYAIITIVIAQLVDNFYFIPFMISGKVKMNPLVSVIIILIFAKLLGIFGMVFCIPMYIIFKTVLIISYEELTRIYTEDEQPIED
ncbi:MAG: AI-2E family transporter [Candidatus Cloacimonetes bacterium]|nr:AI-2E family transporter [Candidatus Cloacimonadota bacterium]